MHFIDVLILHLKHFEKNMASLVSLLPKQCPKLTLARSPVACKFIVGRVEITNVHARLASKILRTISNHGHDG